MTDWLALHGLAALLLLALFSSTWLLSLRLRDSSIVDVLWGPAFAACAWLWFVLTPDDALPRKLIILVACTAWALRLAAHIALRNRGQGEDPRYARWRAENGAPWWWRSCRRCPPRGATSSASPAPR